MDLINETKNKELKEYSVDQRTDSRGRTYYLVRNLKQEFDNGYICFDKSRAFIFIEECYNNPNKFPKIVIEYELSTRPTDGKESRKIIEAHAKE